MLAKFEGAQVRKKQSRLVRNCYELIVRFCNCRNAIETQICLSTECLRCFNEEYVKGIVELILTLGSFKMVTFDIQHLPLQPFSK